MVIWKIVSRTILGNSNKSFRLEMAPKKIAAAKEDKVVKPSGKKEGKRKEVGGGRDQVLSPPRRIQS